MSNTLLPIYNAILQYKQNSKDDRGVEDIVAQLDIDFGVQRHAYLKFLLFPDIYPPCRPPMLFPYPTHMFRDLGSVNLTASGGGLYLAWLPFHRNASNLFSSLTTWNASNTVGVVGTIGTTITGEVVSTHNVPVVNGIDAEHVRGIAAFMTVTYVGRLDEMSGTIETGVMVDDAVLASDGLRYLTTSQLKSCYQYKRTDISEGVRCVWLPLRDADLEPYGAGGGTNPNGIATAYVIHINGCPTGSGYFRVDYGYYYDGIVDETGYHTLMPSRPAKNQPSNQELTNVIRQKSEDFSITPSLVEHSWASKIYNSVKEKLDGGVDALGKFVAGKAVDFVIGSPMGYIK